MTIRKEESFSDWVSLRNLSRKGMITDQGHLDRDPVAFDLAVNVRPYGEVLGPAGGWRSYASLPLADARSFFQGRRAGDPGIALPRPVLIVLGNAGAQEFDGDNWHDISPTAGIPPDEIAGFLGRWTGGYLKGSFCFQFEKGLWTYYSNAAQTNRLEPMIFDKENDADPDFSTWEALGYSAKVVRTWKDFCFAGNTNARHSASSVGDPPPPDFNSNRIMWSAAVVEGAIPTDWVVRDNNEAGYLDLGDTWEPVTEMLPLEDNLVVYKANSTYLLDYIGGQQLFRARLISNTYGCTGPDAVAEYAGLHYLFSRDDLVIFDGRIFKSLLWGRMQKWFQENFDEGGSRDTFVYTDTINEEVIFAFRTKSNPGNFADSAIVLNVRTNSLWLRQWPGRNLAMVRQVQNLNSATIPLQFATVKVAIDRTSNSLIVVDEDPSAGGGVLTSQLENRSLFYDPTLGRVQVDKVRFNETGTSSQITLGQHEAANDTPQYRAPFFNIPATDYKTDARANGMGVAYKWKKEATEDWRLSSLNFKIQRAGDRA
jgi:hypothetical protein